MNNTPVNNITSNVENQSSEEAAQIHNTFDKKLPKESNKKPLKWILVILAVLLLGGGVFLFIVTRPVKDQEVIRPLNGSIVVGDIEIPSNVINPITGVRSAGMDAKDWWIRRPLAVMVNNHVDARPQSGLIDADIVYEVVAEGGITRFLSFFLGETPEKIGPVRSTREYYLVLVKELGDAMIMHIGWSPQALVAIETWPVRSLARGGGDALVWRENPDNVAVEHTAYVNGSALYDLGMDLGWEGKAPLDEWMFKDDTKYADNPGATEVSIDFWTRGDYSAIWQYDSSDNSYFRFMGYDSDDQPIPHVDRESKDQIKVKNVIVQFADESNIVGDEKNRLEYELVGSGDALIFLDGKVVNSTWSKLSRDERTRFYDLDGNEIEFNRGQFWVSIVPTRNVDQVVYN